MTVPAANPSTPSTAPAPWTPPAPLPGPITTPRLVLRFWQLSDAPAMHAAIEASRPTLHPWMPWAVNDNRTVEECIYNIERFRRERERERPSPESYATGIFDRASGEALGSTGLHRLKPELHQAEIGYWVRADRRRQGLCSEAVAHLLSAAFAPQGEGGGGWGFRRIEIFCAGDNEASRGVPARLGLRRECEMRAVRWREGRGWEDTLGWGVLADEWDRQRHALRRSP